MVIAPYIYGVITLLLSHISLYAADRKSTHPDYGDKPLSYP